MVNGSIVLISGLRLAMVYVTENFNPTPDIAVFSVSLDADREPNSYIHIKRLGELCFLK